MNRIRHPGLALGAGRNSVSWNTTFLSKGSRPDLESEIGRVTRAYATLARCGASRGPPGRAFIDPQPLTLTPTPLPEGGGSKKGEEARSMRSRAGSGLAALARA